MTARHRIYIASALENAAAVRELRDALAVRGIGLTYDWTGHGSVQDQGEERIREVGRAEAQGVRDADLVVVLLPGGRGTHTELGIAIGAGVPVVLVGDLLGPDGRTCALYYCEGVERWGGPWPGLTLAAEIARRLPQWRVEPRPGWSERWVCTEARVMALIGARSDLEHSEKTHDRIIADLTSRLDELRRVVGVSRG